MDTTEEVAEKILYYLKRNPPAGDTLEGISKWWVQAECIDQAMDKVSAALEMLVEKGQLIKRQISGHGGSLFFIKDLNGIQSKTKFYGLFRGIVCDNLDPMGLKRLKVKIPALGEELEVWAEPCIPNHDAVVLPVCSSVWIMFEQGDIDHPVWMGTCCP